MPAQVSAMLQLLSLALQTGASLQPPSIIPPCPCSQSTVHSQPTQWHSNPAGQITTQSVPGPYTSFQASNDDAMSTAVSIPPNTVLLHKPIPPDPILSHQFRLHCNSTF